MPQLCIFFEDIVTESAQVLGPSWDNVVQEDRQNYSSAHALETRGEAEGNASLKPVAAHVNALSGQCVPL